MTKKVAPPGRRLLALALDYLVILGYAFILLCCTLAFYFSVFGGIPDIIGTFGRSGAHLIGFTTLTLPVALYLYFTESGKRHATFGKRAMKLQVASTASKSVTRKQILLRTIIKLLPWEFAHAYVYQIVYYSLDGNNPPVWVMVGLTIANLLPIIYFAMVLLRRDHRGPHDLIAKTVVVAK